MPRARSTSVFGFALPVLVPPGLLAAVLALWQSRDANLDVRAAVVLVLTFAALAASLGLFDKPKTTKTKPNANGSVPPAPQAPATNIGKFPEHEVATGLEPDPSDRSEEMTTSLLACHRRALCWSPKDVFDEFSAGLLPPRCPAAAARGPLSLRHYRLARDQEQRRRESAEGRAIDRLLTGMMATSPAIAHHVPARIVDTVDSSWSSPPFAARGHIWSVRIGSSVKNMLYFCILPHGHSERLKCSFLFAKRPGEGYKERRVHDWPAELAGQPWGPTIAEEELSQYRQADGSLLVMVHAVGLGSDADNFSASSLTMSLGASA